jgi:hypothetical protein
LSISIKFTYYTGILGGCLLGEGLGFKPFGLREIIFELLAPYSTNQLDIALRCWPRFWQCYLYFREGNCE